jgi:Fe2+ or Zn2+ uptake regulation protein
MSRASEKSVKLTAQQQRVLKLLFKFRFVSVQLLAQVMNISRPAVYQVLEMLVSKKLVSKVYENDFRIDRKPAYYYMTKQGVTTVRKLMEVKESVVHALYKNDEASHFFIEHCQVVIAGYSALKQTLPPETDMFTKSEINRFKQFPKNRPDLYIRTPDKQEAIIVFAHDSQPYITNKKLDEIITHYEDEEWDGDYPVIAFVLKDDATKNTFLYKVNKKLDNMGMDDDEITILAASLSGLMGTQSNIWGNAFNPRKSVELF